MANWPSGTRMLDTPLATVRVRDTGGTRPAIVMVPDGPCVIEHYDALFAELSDDFRVVCFELPGLGFSYPRPDYDFGISRSVEVVASVLDALDIDRAALAFSCGNGYYALATARAYPQRIERLILIQTPSLAAMRTWVKRAIPRPLRIPVIGQITAAAAADMFASRWFDVALPRDSKIKSDMRERARTALGDGACFCLASIVQGLGTTTENDVSNIDVPTTMIYGDRDWSHKTTDFETFRDLAPDATIHRFEGCGHFPELERPRRFAELLATT